MGVGLTTGPRRITHFVAIAGTALALWLATAPSAFAADTTAPTATILSGPSGITNDASPTFTFTADEPAEFWCSRYPNDPEDYPFTPCESPYTIPPQPNGETTFKVYAVDVAGNSGVLHGDSREFIIDWRRPTVAFAVKPDRVTLARRAKFKPRANEAASFRCRLDGGHWRKCDNAITYRGLDWGHHSIEVIGRDSAGNVGRRGWSWRIVKP